MTPFFQTRRTQDLARPEWLVVVLLATTTCGPRNTPILISFTGDLTDAESIQITPRLNGHPGQVITHDPIQSQRVLWIPESESGRLRIEADGNSSKADACKLAHASAEVTFEPDFRKPTEVELNFTAAQCPLTVELQGIESVTSQPPGLDCPMGGGVCTGWFPRGQAVLLNTGPRPSSRYGQWTGACQAQGASCTVTVNTTSRVVVEDRRGTCSTDDWCLQHSPPRGNDLESVWGSDAQNVWAVDNDGTILKWDGISWSSQDSGVSVWLAAVWGIDKNNVWAVGGGGTILKWNGTAWTAQTSGTSVWLTAIWGSDINNIWAVSRDSTILKWNGLAWSSQSTSSPAWLRAVWGSDAHNIWAVGGSGTILKWNGTSWSSQTSGTSASLNGVWGSDANNVWAVGGSGTILKWNGTSWSSQTSGISTWLYAVSGTDANNVWAVGDVRTILKWNGTSWFSQTNSASTLLKGVWGSASNNVWTVGYATILHYQP